MADVEIDTNVKDFTNRINFGIIVCTSGTRPTAVDGKAIYETDTDLFLIYDGSIWQQVSGGGVTDHGALTGLTDDDHTQYVLVDGTRAMTGNLNINGTAVQSDALEVNIGGSGNRYAFIDLHGDDTYTDYGLRLIRYNTGPNSVSELKHRGTEELKITAFDAASINFLTNNISRFEITTTGLTSTVPLAMGDNDITGADTLQATASQNLTLKVSTGSSIVFQAV